jgi:hypothetical protein
MELENKFVSISVDDIFILRWATYLTRLQFNIYVVGKRFLKYFMHFKALCKNCAEFCLQSMCMFISRCLKNARGAPSEINAYCIRYTIREPQEE